MGDVEGSERARAGERPFQFRLVHLLGAMAWLAVPLALVTQLQGWGWFLAWLWICATLVVGRWPRDASRFAIAACLGIVTAVFSLLFSSMADVRPVARRSMCMNNLHLISIALDSYHQHYGCYPPAFTVDAAGRPMHSWRVLILPFMERQQLYDQYRMDEPWDGPNNSKLLATTVDVFSCPSDPNPLQGTETSYVVVVGPGTPFPGTASTKSSDVADGLSNTLLVVEVQNSGIHWMEPRDLPLAAIGAGVNSKTARGVASGHAGCAVVTFMDGRTMSLSEGISPGALRALCTIAGKEPLRTSNTVDFELAPAAPGPATAANSQQ